MLSVDDPSSDVPSGQSLGLPRGIVHLVVLSLESLEDRLDELGAVLSADEQAKAARYRFDRDRHRFVLGRAALRHVLAAYVGRPPEELQFDYGEFGKPALRGQDGVEAIRFNASGSQGLAAIAVGRGGEVGVDIEQIRSFDDWSRIVSRFFIVGERQALFRLPTHRQLEAFFHCWTLKEAVLKVTGQGLQEGLDRFEVSVDPLEPPSVVWREPESGRLGPQSLWTFRARGRVLVALASQGQITNVKTGDIPGPLRAASVEWTARAMTPPIEGPP